MRVLVSGGAGFIGSHVVELLERKGYEVGVLDNLSTGRRENLPRSVPLFVADLCDRPSVRKIFEEFRPTHLLHLAAQPSVKVSVDDPARDSLVNVVGGLHALEEARRVGVEGVVFAGSGGAVYGEVPENSSGAREEWPLSPQSPYGVSKASFEMYLRVFESLHSLRSVILRYANVYGPRQDPNGEAGVVAIFSHQALRNLPLTLYARRRVGDGGCLRDYIHVHDVAEAHLVALEGGFGWGVSRGAVINIGTGVPRKTREVLEKILESSGNSPPLHEAPPRKGDLEVSFLNIDRASRMGWEPKVGFEEGIRSTLESFRENLSPSAIEPSSNPRSLLRDHL